MNIYIRTYKDTSFHLDSKNYNLCHQTNLKGRITFVHIVLENFCASTSWHTGTNTHKTKSLQPCQQLCEAQLQNTQPADVSTATMLKC